MLMDLLTALHISYIVRAAIEAPVKASISTPVLEMHLTSHKTSTFDSYSSRLHWTLILVKATEWHNGIKSNWQRSFFVPVFSLHLPWGRRIICREEVSCVLGGRHCSWKGSIPCHWSQSPCVVLFSALDFGYYLFKSYTRSQNLQQKLFIVTDLGIQNRHLLHKPYRNRATLSQDCIP